MVNLPDASKNPVLTGVDDLLDRFTHFGVELGLERITRLLEALGNPQRQVPILHVAGSNGKGSVCAYLSSVLAEAGYRVGRYTSPHLVSWCERINLNGQDIAAVELEELLQKVIGAIDPNHSSPTQFEVITAAAWLYFAQQQIDIAVMEVGLGGRLDATNVCDRPLVSVITSLSLEHWQRLGPTLDKIAYEKAGILKPGCPAVIAPQPPIAATMLHQRLAELDCPAVWVQPSQEADEGWAEYGSGSETIRYPLPLLGAHQLINSAVAIATLQILQAQGWSISEAQIAAGMAKTRWAGRLQWYDWQGQKILIDGAHNPAGAEVLREYLDRQGKASVHWVMGMIANKDHADVFAALLRPGDFLYLVPVPEHLPVDLEKLATLAQEVCPNLKHCEIYPDVLAGLNAAALDRQAESAIVLCGSLYLIGHFFKLQGI
ncbi:MAG: bifunctional folylpolyglutamate synthase/dihydrofolate synthase [Drouetiella hepatica Uher 2000/2452]|jgi:dihydrofolate synthase/folylpolyglutamate synthase|uniref:tetrahydrofolate synthase n=1 Tax=Drouetiella hepatica Uher 2000/2452 TaxID=904376 RepID=A0A951QDD2_9CYAN|nr:bifunctional folylpolyglutamate synthase/dihydrofolate synthase [Drouetiella hepatica Uher 2000/2452]